MAKMCDAGRRRLQCSSLPIRIASARAASRIWSVRMSVWALAGRLRCELVPMTMPFGNCPFPGRKSAPIAIAEPAQQHALMSLRASAVGLGLAAWFRAVKRRCADTSETIATRGGELPLNTRRNSPGSMMGRGLRGCANRPALTRTIRSWRSSDSIDELILHDTVSMDL